MTRPQDFSFSSFESSYALYSLHVYLGDLLILVLCDDTILALRYIHALHTYGTYIYLHIHLSSYLQSSVCLSIPQVRYNISLFFFSSWNGMEVLG